MYITFYFVRIKDWFLTSSNSSNGSNNRKGVELMGYLNLPFTQYDPAYLESLPDDVFFARRFKLSQEDEAILMKNSRVVHGKRFFRAKILEPMMAKYAALTNPKEGEPGSKTNPLVRFGKEYVYSGNGDLVPFVRNARQCRSERAVDYNGWSKCRNV